MNVFKGLNLFSLTDEELSTLGNLVYKEKRSRIENKIQEDLSSVSPLTEEEWGLLGKDTTLAAKAYQSRMKVSAIEAWTIVTMFRDGYFKNHSQR